MSHQAFFARISRQRRCFAQGVSLSLLVLATASACRVPYKYAYEKPTGVGVTDRANDYCRKAADKQGYSSVREVGPITQDTPTQLDVRMRVTDGNGELMVSCAFDDVKRIAALPRPQRGSTGGDVGYRSSDAKLARQVCDQAVKSSGYDARSVSVAQWAGGRQFRVNVAVRQGGADRNVACRYDGVAGTAAVPPVTK
ncbi:MAG: hypothetical protein M3Y64_06565 [Gemmatimonadota bacterium]|nr:hypothetical protein [Gemmatimonadota bacterium]